MGFNIGDIVNLRSVQDLSHNYAISIAGDVIIDHMRSVPTEIIFFEYDDFEVVNIREDSMVLIQNEEECFWIYPEVLYLVRSADKRDEDICTNITEYLELYGGTYGNNC